MAVSDRAHREQRFHDDAFSTDARAETWRFYRAVEHLFAEYRRRVGEGPAGRDVLEIGCGRGGCAFDLAARGDRVVAIDVSPVALGITAAIAAQRGVVVDTRRMDAQTLDFGDRCFDLVCGSGILHHVDLDAVASEVRRVLRPGGRAVFVEPLGHNPVINWYRHRTPQLRSPDERPLRLADLRTLRHGFGDVQFVFGGVFTLPFVAGAASSRPAWLDRAVRFERRGLTARPWALAAWFVLIDAHAGAPADAGWRAIAT